ncbi:MAG TPA: methyltransferase domain-containing protein, partial [Negativicutes bacterium]|nr:methyltransferase domain-containing protein [Negativicutes bacterium]
MYTNLAGYFEAIFPVEETQLGLIREVLQSVNGRRVLDAACGSGGYSFALTREGCAVTGIDLDPGM